MAKKVGLLNEVRNEQLPRLKLGRGRSKHQDKIADRNNAKDNLDWSKVNDSLTQRFYYRESTFEETCAKKRDVWRFANNTEGKRLSIEELNQSDYPERYLSHRKKLAEEGKITARTLAKERSLIQKGFQRDMSHVEILPCTSESDKGRGKDRHWNWDNHTDEWDFYASVGARKGEYRYITPGELSDSAKKTLAKYNLTAKTTLHGFISNLVPIYNAEKEVEKVIILKAKHGKCNVAEIIPQNRKLVTEAFDSGRYSGYFNPSDHCNVHAARRQYGQDLYQHIRETRPELYDLPRHEKYYTRDGKHRQYDKIALARVSSSLGHGHDRHFNVVHNYLR